MLYHTGRIATAIFRVANGTMSESFETHIYLFQLLLPPDPASRFFWGITENSLPHKGKSLTSARLFLVTG